MRSRGVVLGVLVAMAACGDDGLRPAPEMISAGPVTIDTRTMTLTLDSSPALVQPQFLSIGTAATVEEAHYYDPRGDDRVTLAPITKAIGIVGDWVVLEGQHADPDPSPSLTRPFRTPRRRQSASRAAISRASPMCPHGKHVRRRAAGTSMW